MGLLWAGGVARAEERIHVRGTGGVHRKFKHLDRVLGALHRTLGEPEPWGRHWGEKVRYSGRFSDYTFRELAPELRRILTDGTLQLEFRESRPTRLGTAAAQTLDAKRIILFPAAGRHPDKAEYSDYHLARTLFHELMHVWQQRTFTRVGLIMDTETFPTEWERRLPETHFSTGVTRDPGGATPVPAAKAPGAGASAGDFWPRVQARLAPGLKGLGLHPRNPRRPLGKTLDGTFWFRVPEGVVTVRYPVWIWVSRKGSTPRHLEQRGERDWKFRVQPLAIRTTVLRSASAFEARMADRERGLRRQFEERGRSSGGRMIEGDRFKLQTVRTPYVVRARDLRIAGFPGKLLTTAPTGRRLGPGGIFVSRQVGGSEQAALIFDWDYRTTPDQVVAGFTFTLGAGKRYAVELDTWRQAHRAPEIPMASEADVLRILTRMAEVVRAELAR